MDLIDREALVEELNELYGEQTVSKYSYSRDCREARFGITLATNKVKTAPTVDVVPVVRCRDCFHFEPYGHRDAVGVCKLNNNSEWRGEEDYCSKWHEDGE